MNKIYIPLVFAACLLSACTQPNAIEFKVSAPGLQSGTFVIKDGAQTLFGENIQNGASEVKGVLESPGLYELDIVKDGDKQPAAPFEIYLEPAVYTITVDANDLGKYPKITSNSAKQQEISDYNDVYQKMAGQTKEQTAKLNKDFEERSHSLSPADYKALLKKIDNSQAEEQNSKLNALAQFVKTHPQSTMAAHFMAKKEYDKNPEDYGKLFAQLSPDAKNSFDGKQIAQTLTAEAHLQIGKPAPQIAGKLFDGKHFSSVKTGKKLYLVDFWRSANSISRTNHEKIQSVYKDFEGKGFQVISVSLDSKPLWWHTAVTDDKLPWPQVSDLKGNDSPNAANWHITSIPTYYLVDGNWNILSKDISLSSLSLQVTEYFEKRR